METPRGGPVMNDPTLESLAQQAALGDKAAAEAFFLRLRDVLQLLPSEVLERIGHLALYLKSHADQAVASAADDELAKAPPLTKLTPELREWARQNFNEADFLAGLRDIREHGG